VVAERATSALGLVALIAIAWAMSSDRRQIPWRIVFWGLAILLGGIGGLAPSRRPEVALLGVRSIVSGSLATFMTACVAGLLV
jgi:nucleoside permease NupC